MCGNCLFKQIILFHSFMEEFMYGFEENKRIKREEYPQLRESTGGVIAIALGLQPAFFMSGDQRSERSFLKRFRKKK